MIRDSSFMNNLYYVCVVGSMQQTLSIWKNNHLLVDFVETIHDVLKEQSYDYLFLSTPVSWSPDGVFDDQELQEHVAIARQAGYDQQIVLTATLPIGVAGKLQCHYLPIQQYLICCFNKTPVLFGCYDKILVDRDSLYNFMSLLFNTKKISLYYTDAVEMIFLISLCQHYINQSFYKEMSHFCFKNKIHIDFQSISLIFYQDMTPILIYMIQQMEEAKLDCPILYSCLFRQHYIDIPI